MRTGVSLSVIPSELDWFGAGVKGPSRDRNAHKSTMAGADCAAERRGAWHDAIMRKTGKQDAALAHPESIPRSPEATHWTGAAMSEPAGVSIRVCVCGDFPRLSF